MCVCVCARARSRTCVCVCGRACACARRWRGCRWRACAHARVRLERVGLCLRAHAVPACLLNPRGNVEQGQRATMLGTTMSDGKRPARARTKCSQSMYCTCPRCLAPSFLCSSGLRAASELPCPPHPHSRRSALHTAPPGEAPASSCASAGRFILFFADEQSEFTVLLPTRLLWRAGRFAQEHPVAALSPVASGSKPNTGSSEPPEVQRETLSSSMANMSRAEKLMFLRWVCVFLRVRARAFSRHSPLFFPRTHARTHARTQIRTQIRMQIRTQMRTCTLICVTAATFDGSKSTPFTPRPSRFHQV